MNKPITANSSASFICRKYSRIFFPRPENRQVASPAFLSLTSPPSQTVSESTKCLSSSRVISGPSTVLLCGCQVANAQMLLCFFFLLNHPRPKRDLLLCVARHTAVTLTRNAPLSKAPSPGISVSRVEPSGVFVSRFCLSSSRSLGRCLLLGQRSRMNFFSHHIRSLFHQDHGNPNTDFSRHFYNCHPGSLTAWMSVANQTEKLPQLSVLTDRRPGSLDHFTSQPFISRMGDRTPIGSRSGGVLGRDQTQKSAQLADVSKLSPIANASQKLTGHNPADSRHAHHILYTLGQFRIVLAEAADLSGRLKDLLLVKLQAVEPLIKLKAHGRRTGKLSQFILHHERPLATGRSWGKLHPFHEQQRFDALLHPHHLAYKGVAQLGEVTKLPIKRARNMDPFELSSTQILGQSDTVEPIGLHSLSWRFGNHRWRGDQAPKVLRYQPIIQPVACRSSLIGKSHLLIGKVLTHVIHKMLHVVRHAQRFKQSLMIRKGHRDASLVHIESGKHIIVTRDECLVPHRSASFGSTAKILTTVPVTEHSALTTTSLIQVSGQANSQVTWATKVDGNS